MSNVDKRIVILNGDDNVATATCLIPSSNSISFQRNNSMEEVVVIEDIPLGHKIALEDIPVDSHIIKYGEIIGKAATYIEKGSLVHIHNVESLRGRGDLAKEEAVIK